ncbi:MAG: M20/M25/M40 family metallo-hydrolase, partial [Candidatus Muiribacteriaceae bacterium]
MTVNQERLIKEFFTLVSIDSASREEREIVDYTKNRLSKLGCEVKEDDTGEKIGGNAGNVVATYPGDSKAPVIMLSAHLDRVKPGKGIKPIIKDNYIISGGNTILAGDDIIGVASIIEALTVLNEENIPHGNVKLIFTVAEEIGLLGAKNINDYELKGIDYGLVYDGDGDVGTIIYKAPTKYKFNSVIKGKSAHAGMAPENGVNAIKIASKA